MDMVGDGGRMSDPLEGDSPSPNQSNISIVHVSSLGQSQSVIQAANQQSVIQSPNQLTKGNLILVGKSNSVIQTTGGHTLQVVSEQESDFYEDDATKKRREILARRPSYRKILNDLAGDEEKGSLQNDDDDDQSPVINLASIAPSSRGNLTTLSGSHYAGSSGLLKVIPASAIHIAGSQSNGLQTIAMSSANDSHPTFVQYTQGQDGSQQFIVPVGVSGDLQTYTLRPVTTTASLPQGIVVASPSSPEDRKRPLSTDSKGRSGGEGEWSDIQEPLIQKRELRLLKNREAARECRRKKKEYIKCLENRVAVLENQNKALIEELKNLKDAYCSQKDELH